jgi:hypothetical protein
MGDMARSGLKAAGGPQAMLARPDLCGAWGDDVSRHCIAGGRLGSPHCHAALCPRHRQADCQLTARLLGQKGCGVEAPHPLKLVAGGQRLVWLGLQQRK